jgi:plastocyanin
MHIFKTASFCAALGPLAIVAAAHAQEARPMTITLTSYAFTPANINLKAGAPVTLHLVNDASKSHDFSAPKFFEAATIAPADKSKVVDGAVDLDEGQSVDVTVTPTRAGTYDLECTHFMHTMLGMTGKIVVQ